MGRIIKRQAALLTAVALGALANPALAQDAPTESSSQNQPAQTQPRDGGTALSGDIIVTAQRREQNVQKVGAVTAFFGAEGCDKPRWKKDKMGVDAPESMGDAFRAETEL